MTQSSFIEKQTFKIEPYARLLTMLGDQLIKDERIALVELIKNAYDADAKWVKVSFENFVLEKGHYKFTEESRIVIEDDGSGMTLDTIKNAWMNPATPHKHTSGKKQKTTSGRVIQGEKGIGRFAILKLGRKIKILTRSKEDKREFEIDYDLSKYDDNFLSLNGKPQDIYLSSLGIDIYEHATPQIIDYKLPISNYLFDRHDHGTRIEISNLRGSWSSKKIANVYEDISKLESIFTKLFKDDKSVPDDFTIGITLNGEKISAEEDYAETFRNTLENDAVFLIEGTFDEEKFVYDQTHNGVLSKNKELLLDDTELKGLYVYKKAFGETEEDSDEEKSDKKKKKKKKLIFRKPECGPFSFKFFIFDLNKNSGKFTLQPDQKNIIKKHRIYLYRDGIRVYPYGDPADDWLNIDVIRGTQSAGQVFGNDQVVGYIEITHDNNPKLIDKTSREGLIEEGNATRDFIGLIQSLLSYIRGKDYAQYLLKEKSKKPVEIYKENRIEESIKVLQATVSDPSTLTIVNKIKSDYKLEKDYLIQRAEKTEDLAGVGLSVETASHDIMSFMSKALLAVNDLMTSVASESLKNDQIFAELSKIKGLCSFVDSQLKDIQLIFRSAKRRRTMIRINEMVQKVERIYKRHLERNNISFEVNIVQGSPLIAKTTEAVLLQLLINLFDNAIYWLEVSNNDNKRILITLDGNEGEMIFSDNGPGIREEDQAFIFEPFYSGRGEEGKGLGLYIAKQLLERSDYSIELADKQRLKKLSGANFVISFISEE